MCVLDTHSLSLSLRELIVSVIHRRETDGDGEVVMVVDIDREFFYGKLSAHFWQVTTYGNNVMDYGFNFCDGS